MINTTQCNILPNQSNLITREANVVTCLPQFDVDGERLPNDGQAVKISVPVPNGKLEAAIDAAKDTWSNMLSFRGLNITFTKIYVTCLPLDNHCIEVRVQNPPANPIACGQTLASLDQDGVMRERAITYIHPGYTEFTQTYVNQVLMHELGHLLGLDDQAPNCLAGSIMNTPVGQTCDGVMTGLSSAPQTSDVIPVAKSTYGQTPKKTCS